MSESDYGIQRLWRSQYKERICRGVAKRAILSNGFARHILRKIACKDVFLGKNLYLETKYLEYEESLLKSSKRPVNMITLEYIWRNVQIWP